MTGVKCVRCPHRAVQRHHVIYGQELRRHGGPALLRDDRGRVPICKRCHERHHQRVDPLPAWVLPDEVFEFTLEVLGAGPGFEYLRRRYGGDDPRLESLRLEADGQTTPQTA